MLTLHTTALFRKDYRLAKNRGLDLSLLESTLNTLLEQKPLSLQYRDHLLTGNYAGYRECHVQNDWLLIYRVDSINLILVAARTGTHSDLF